MSWSFDQSTPIYIQIAERLKEMIVRGDFPPGEKLPSVRDLAFSSSANPNTIQRAFFILEQEGLVMTEGTHGRRVTSRDDVISAARQEMLTAHARVFAFHARSLGCSPDEAAELVRTFDFTKEEYDVYPNS